jgi:hypothetical protein
VSGPNDGVSPEGRFCLAECSSNKLLDGWWPSYSGAGVSLMALYYILQVRQNRISLDLSSEPCNMERENQT